MRRVLEKKAELIAGLSGAVGAYASFLERASRCPGCEPALIVDLLWHTHMLFPVKYSSDCVRLTGTLLHHEDDPAVSE